MAPIIAQEQQRLALLDLTGKHIERVRAMQILSAEQLAWPRPDGGWSAAQIVEHMLIANESYLPRMDALTRQAHRRAQSGAVWKPSLFGNLLIKAIASPRKFKAPKLFGDVLRPRDDICRVFADQLERLQHLLETASEVSWHRTRTSSPVSRFIRLNLGDCFTILVTHTERHLGQIDRLRDLPGFPTAAGKARSAPS